MATGPTFGHWSITEIWWVASGNSAVLGKIWCYCLPFMLPWTFSKCYLNLESHLVISRKSMRKWPGFGSDNFRPWNQNLYLPTSQLLALWKINSYPSFLLLKTFTIDTLLHCWDLCQVGRWEKPVNLASVSRRGWPEPSFPGFWNSNRILFSFMISLTVLDLPPVSIWELSIQMFSLVYVETSVLILKPILTVAISSWAWRILRYFVCPHVHQLHLKIVCIWQFNRWHFISVGENGWFNMRIGYSFECTDWS